jgi:hypothetical protein
MRTTTTARRTAVALAAAASVLAAGASAAQAAPHADLKVEGLTTSGIFTTQTGFGGLTLLPIRHGIAAADVSPRLTGTGSTPSPGATITQYAWDLATNGAAFTFPGTNPYVYMRAGAYGEDRSAAMQVKDSTGATDVARLRFRMVQMPEPSLTAPAVAKVGDPVVFDASKSKAWLDGGQPGEIQSYEWDEDGDGTYERTTNANTPRIAHTFTKASASACVKVRVIDQNGAMPSPVRACVRVHTAPTATFTATPKPAEAGKEITLDASDSTDDTSIVNYEWDLDGNGTFEKNGGAAKTTKVTFPKNGAFTVGLRVTDSDGATGTTTQTIQVGPVAATTKVAVPTTGSAQPVTQPQQQQSPLKLSGLSLSRSAFAPVRGAGRVQGRRGARLRVTVSERSTLSLRFSRVLRGRRSVSGSCRIGARRGRVCTRTRYTGAASVALRAGANDVLLTGRAGGVTLARGSYRVTVSARTADGRTTAAITKALTITGA